MTGSTRSPRGGVLRVRNFRRDVFDPAVRDAGPAGFRPHELRHTAASLGHKTATMTLDLCGHLFPDRLNDVADRMDAAVSARNVPRE